MKKSGFFGGILRRQLVAVMAAMALMVGGLTFAQEAAPAPADNAAPAAEATAPEAAAPAAEAAAPAENEAAPEADKKADAEDGNAAPAGEAEPKPNDEMKKYQIYWLLALIGSLAALIFARIFYVTMMKADEGNAEMVEIASAVREGADAYLWQQYKVVFYAFVVIWVFLMYLAFGLGVQNKSCRSPS